MRFHVLALPNVQTTREYSMDGFCNKTIRFCRLLKELGHTVFLYASEENEAPCDELVTTITKEEQNTLLTKSLTEKTHYSDAAMDDRYPLWQLSNTRMVKEIAKRKQPRDFICTIGGGSQQWVCEQHSDLMTVEYGIGYIGSFSKYRIYESHTWRATTYGAQKFDNGDHYDAVIYNFFDPSEFPFREKPDDYFVYGGRLVARKGLSTVQDACEAAGVKLKMFGHGDRSLVRPTTEYLGEPDEDERNRILAGAKALISPTMYIEPFNNVVAQSQLCGTPVISTDFGSFSELVEQGKTGFRCHILNDFVQAIKNIDSIDRKYVRERAVMMFSMETAKPLYQAYFERLMTLWDGGWYWLPNKKPAGQLWMPDQSAANPSDNGMWDAWAAKVKASLPNFASHAIYVSQDEIPENEFERVAEQVMASGPIDLNGKVRDIEFGARAVATKHGKVTRQWLDSNVEIDFLRRHMKELKNFTVLDIGAGYGRLAVPLSGCVRSYTCTDTVPISTELCRKYVGRFAPTVTVSTREECESIQSLDLAINIHSWNECSPHQIKEWLDFLAKRNVIYLFTVSHGQNDDGSSYRSWSPNMSEFKSMIAEQFYLVAEESLGLSNHPHALWRRKNT